MGPGSGSFAAVTWVVAVSALIGGALLGARLGGGGIRRFAARVAIQVVVAVVCVLAVMTSANAYYGWYTDWSDLGADLAGSPLAKVPERTFGRVPEKAAFAALAVEHNAASQRRFGHERHLAEHRLGVRPSRQGQWLEATIPGMGPVFKGKTSYEKVDIWLPPSYGSPRMAGHTFPVLVALHGWPGTRADMRAHLPLESMILDQVRSGRMRESVVVVPEYSPSGYDTECTNIPGAQVNTWLGSTIPTWVMRHLRVDTDRSSWATIGYSAGGYCAAAVTMRHPSTFGSAIVLGGYFQAEWSNWKPKVADPDSDLIHLAATRPPEVNIYLELSGKDGTVLHNDRQFLRAVRAPTSATVVTYPDAGHRISVWAAATPAALDWLGRTGAGFAPTMVEAHTRSLPERA